MRQVLWFVAVSTCVACGDAANGVADVDSRANVDANVDTDVVDTTRTSDTTTPDADVLATDVIDTSGPDSTDIQVDSDATEVDDDAADTTDSDMPDVTVDGDAAADTAPDTAPTTWRSALYPADWTPATTDPSGAFLHDFSYAGYHNGELPLGDGVADGGVAGLTRFDVTTYGALPVALDQPGEASDATAAIQAAIDAAQGAGGGLVYVPAGLYRVDGLLRVSASHIVIGGDGADTSRLWFTKQTGVDFSSQLRFAGASTKVAEAALTSDGPSRETLLHVADTSAFMIGDDVQVGQVISDAFIAEHGMTGTWQAFNGTWQPFFHRTVLAVDPEAQTIRVDVPLRYPMKTAYQATVRKVSGVLREVGLQDLGVANAIAWADAWAISQVHVVAFEHVADAWVRGLASFPSPGAPTSGFGIGSHLIGNGLLVLMSKRVTVADSHLALAENRGSGGNGYLFELRQSSEVLTRDCTGELGRHNFIQNWGFGTTGCVWQRVVSSGGANVLSPDFDFQVPAYSEYHHSLATANLYDSSRADDGFSAVNRGTESTGAGQSATECVFWNTSGARVISRQYARGYVIGTEPGVEVATKVETLNGIGTAPEDWREGVGEASTMQPQSLYDDQLARRLGR